MKISYSKLSNVPNITHDGDIITIPLIFNVKDSYIEWTNNISNKIIVANVKDSKPFINIPVGRSIIIRTNYKFYLKDTKLKKYKLDVHENVYRFVTGITLKVVDENEDGLFVVIKNNANTNIHIISEVFKISLKVVERYNIEIVE